MFCNSVKNALSEKKVTLGTWIQLGDPGISEILANAGFDWIGIDCEHTDIDVECFSNLARGMYGRGAVPIVRVRENDTMAIRQVLDAGAEGVIIPLVNSADEARRVVSAAKYPPQGIRGYAFSRVNNWGVDFDRYCTEANDNIVVIVMAETKEAVEKIDEILAVDGVDGIFIGPYDLSGSYGVLGQVSHPLITKALDKVLGACRRHNKAAGLHVVNPDNESVVQAIEDGFTFIALGIDTIFLNTAARNALKIAQAAVSKK